MPVYEYELERKIPSKRTVITETGEITADNYQQAISLMNNKILGLPNGWYLKTLAAK